MAMIELPEFVAGADGYEVLPAGRWTCTPDAFTARFIAGLPDSSRRKEIFEDFVIYRDMQEGHGLKVLSYWIDGSFTSSKLNPGDIDVTAIIDGPASSPVGDFNDWINPGDRWKTLAHPAVGRTLQVDGYGVVKAPDGTEQSKTYMAMRGYWDDWWQRCRSSGEQLSKGYVEVVF